MCLDIKVKGINEMISAIQYDSKQKGGLVRAWRALFVLGGSLVIAGGSQHPRGSMVDMLAHPDWLPSHAVALLGVVTLVAGLVCYRRAIAPSGSTRRWVTISIAVATLQAFEWGLHTFAYVDAARLAAGEATPVLTTHLWLATIIYTPFGIAVIGLIIAGVRERSLGSPWIAWLGIVGATTHGVVMILLFILELEQFEVLVWFSVLMALWFMLAGLWPARDRGRPA